MALWEYKVITSGKGGFASPALLEKFLNDLGREDWEIVQFHTQPDNFLVFTGLARRPTQRDWTLEDAAAAAAKVEADKLRAEFEAKFKAATTNAASAGEPASASFIEEKAAPDDGFRSLIDTSHDADTDEEKEEDDWDKLTAAEEDELPTFFDAIKPHMRRNQRGPGMSVGVDYLAKKWDQSEEDLKGALEECGFTMPADEDAKPEYLEFEGDLYWININRRGELWINTKEKPRPVFKSVKAQKIELPDEQRPDKGQKHDKHEKHERKEQKPESAEQHGGETPSARPEGGAKPSEDSAHGSAPTQPTDSAPGQSLPAGPELLDKIRPLMRRNRRGPGGSGSASFLSRALKTREADLVEGFKALGLVVPSSANEKPTNVEIANTVWWINVDSRGNVWINGREKKHGETIDAAGEPADSGTAAAEAPSSATSAEVGTSAEPSSTPEQAARGAGTVKLTVVPAESAPNTAAPEAIPAPEIAPASGESTSAPTGQASRTKSGDTGAFSTLRPLLKETKSGAFAAKIERLAEATAKSAEDILSALTAAGLTVPEKPREKPAFVEQDSENFWLSRNARGELWLNAKPAKSASESDEDAADAESGGTADDGAEGADKKPKRSRSRKKSE